jgi:hypothetical protein
MRMKTAAVAAIAALPLAIGASTFPAAATETIIATDAAGDISIPDLTGDSAARVMSSYSGFAQADITSISSTLDPATKTVIPQGLHALQADNSCPSGGDCSDATLSLPLTLTTSGDASCPVSRDIGGCGEFSAEADKSLTPIAAQERSAWGMMLDGFASLELAR